MSNNEKSPVPGFILAAATACLIAFCFFWFNRGYGKVSPRAYEYSRAIYSTCLIKSEEGLARVEDQLANEEAADLTDREKSWLDSILAKARAGDWQAASQKAKRMMEDQVEY